MIKLGFAGTGHINEVHADAAKNLNDISLEGVFSRNKETGKKFADKFNISKFYTNYEEMLNEVDAVIIGLPTPLHKEFSIKALNFSRHVLCEKPITLYLNEALEIKEAVDRSKKIFMVAHVLRFWPEYVAAKKIIKEGSAGKIKKIYAYRFSSVPKWSANSWLLDKNKSGGVPVDLLIHDIDFIRWILGEPDNYYSVGVKNEDGLVYNSAVSFKYKNATGIAEAGYVLSENFRFRMGFKIIAENVILDYYNLREPSLISERPDGIANSVLFENSNAYANQLSYFIKCIKNNSVPSRISLSDAINNITIAGKFNF